MLLWYEIYIYIYMLTLNIIYACKHTNRNTVFIPILISLVFGPQPPFGPVFSYKNNNNFFKKVYLWPLGILFMYAWKYLTDLCSFICCSFSFNLLSLSIASLFSWSIRSFSLCLLSSAALRCSSFFLSSSSLCKKKI